MKACGFTLPNAPLTPRQDIKAFVELHIEQGCVLESNGQSIGVVNAIVGQRRYTVTLNGESNHAGTTPMGYRRDTVYAFSRICHQSIEKRKDGRSASSDLWQSRAASEYGECGTG